MSWPRCQELLLDSRLTFRLVSIFTHNFIPQSSCNCREIPKESHISESYLCNNDARLTSGLPFGDSRPLLKLSRLLTIPTSKVATLTSEFFYIESTTVSFDTEVLIGAGMSGLGLAVQLIRKFGVNSFEIIEKSNDVGGTWLLHTSTPTPLLSILTGLESTRCDLRYGSISAPSPNNIILYLTSNSTLP